MVFYNRNRIRPYQCEGEALNNLCNSSAITKLQAVICVAIITTSIVVAVYGLTAFELNPVPFSMNVVNRPASFGEILHSIPSQKCLFLVVIEEPSDAHDLKPVRISATSPDCEATVSPQAITSGQVAEVMAIPTEDCVGKNVTITIQGEREGLKKTETVTFEVIEAEDREETLGPQAAELRDKFIQWLSTAHPELGITSRTDWTGTVVNPMILVVMHYIFWSEDWEMYVTWHVMIPPYDWARIYLRHRFNATAPSYAFEISSVQGQTEPMAIEVPDWV